MIRKGRDSNWWEFLENSVGRPATGEFAAACVDQADRLYFPIFNEAGMLSWASPKLQGGPAAGHNEHLGFPLTAEDLPNALTHRGFWLAEKDRSPFSLSALSPEGLRYSVGKGHPGHSWVNAGPGWFTLSREDPAGRFVVRATLWCPADVDQKLELMWVEVVSTARQKLTLTPYAAIPLFARSADNIRDHRHVTALLNRVELHRHGVIVCPTMSFDERGHKLNKVRYGVLAFGPRGAAPEAVWPTQESFLGRGGSFAAPAAVWHREPAPQLQSLHVQGREAVGGFRFADVALRRGQAARFLLVSGITEDPRGVREWIRWAGEPNAAARSLAFTRDYWEQKVRRVAFLTPDAKLNNWLAWVNFQPILRRWYGNSFLPQFDYGRGGKGWRDLWQDCLALLLSDPGSVRDMLLHNFAGVRIDGSNATIIGKGATFIADRNNIPRTWMDHGCWPTYTTLLYVDQTGDLDFLLRRQTYFRDPQTHRCRQRDPKWTESCGFSLRSRNGRLVEGTVFEHMLVQNLTAFFNVGEHNVCRLEGADWNDGLDMADRRGESVAFSSFYAWNLDRLAQAAETLAAAGHGELRLACELKMLLDRLPGQKRVNYGSARAKVRRLEQYFDVVARDVSEKKMLVRVEDLVCDLRAKSRDLAARIRTQEWVHGSAGSAFFNGYYDDNGHRVEGRHASHRSEAQGTGHAHGTRMMLTSQVFPLMSGIATEEQARHVIAACRRFLKDPRTGGMRLNTDFGGIQPALGRAFSFAYGEKENGAVFSHMAVMYAFALYRRRRPAEGREVWSALYRMAADLRAGILPGVPEYFNAEGRGMYSYLTGSASWLVYLLLTQVFGVRGQMGDLVIDPQLTRDDFDGNGETSIRTFFAGKPLVITFRNPTGLKPGAYAVGRVMRGRAPLAFVPAACGVRLGRSVFRSFPADRDTRLVVELVRAK